MFVFLSINLWNQRGIKAVTMVNRNLALTYGFFAVSLAMQLLGAEAYYGYGSSEEGKSLLFFECMIWPWDKERGYSFIVFHIACRLRSSRAFAPKNLWLLMQNRCLIFNFSSKQNTFDLLKLYSQKCPFINPSST